jgi:hypothetical protein
VTIEDLSRFEQLLAATPASYQIRIREGEQEALCKALNAVRQTAVASLPFVGVPIMVDPFMPPNRAALVEMRGGFPHRVVHILNLEIPPGGQEVKER